MYVCTGYWIRARRDFHLTCYKYSVMPNRAWYTLHQHGNDFLLNMLRNGDENSDECQKTCTEYQVRESLELGRTELWVRYSCLFSSTFTELFVGCRFTSKWTSPQEGCFSHPLLFSFTQGFASLRDVKWVPRTTVRKILRSLMQAVDLKAPTLVNQLSVR